MLHESLRTAHPALAASAAETGVTLLAGTDSRPHGTIADEIRAPADAVIYDSDPREDLSVLDHPHAVILHGRLARRRKRP